MRWIKQHGLTKITIVIILLTVIFAQFSQKKWNDDMDVITSDVRGYYAYLPALFIHNDLKLENLDVYDSPWGLQIWFSTHEDGTRFVKFTSGMAILYSPFFLVAHAFAESLGAPADGFSYPYKFALAMSAIVYLFIALLFMSKLLLRYFSDSTTSIVLLILFVGTNALHYYTGNMTYSHGYSFALVAVFLYCTVRWIEQPHWKWALWIGVTSGLFVLIRPVDILFLLALPLLNVRSLGDIQSRFLLFWRHKLHILIMLFFFGLMLLPQLLYFKYISGSFIFYSYTGEPFFFGSPNTFNSLFSYRNGWLLYSPLMILSLIGLFFLRKQKINFSFFIVPVVLLYIYVISAWWCWWYVGFGNRAFINLYPILAIPLACLVQYIISSGKAQRIAFKTLVFIGVIFSVFQTYQFSTGAIHWGAMTKDAYWDSFLREHPSQLFSTMLRYPVTDKQIAGKNTVFAPIEKTIYTQSYSFDSAKDCDSTMRNFQQLTEGKNNSGSIHLNDGDEYLGLIPLPVRGLNAIYATAWVKNLPEDVHLALSKVDPGYYHSSDEVIERQGGWSKINMFARVPDNFGADSIDFIIWNQGRQGLILDDLTIKGLHYTFEEVDY